MINKPTEKGQALIVIALAAVVLFGFAALAIDGSAAFSDKRHAQNAADTAVMAAALAYSHSNDLTPAAQDNVINSTAFARTLSNGYDNNGTTNIVKVTITDISADSTERCPGKAIGKYIKVDIASAVQTSLARVIGQKQLVSRVSATSRACGTINAPLFPGAAIVGLDQLYTVHGGHLADCGFDTGGNGTWNITGGGVFSNGCAAGGGSSSVNLDAGQCVTTVGVAQGFNCQSQNNSTQLLNYPGDVLAMMPPNPCDHTPGDVGLPQSSGITSGNTVSFNSGVYCISDMTALDSKDIVLNNATLYVTQPVFNLKFTGGGGFSGTPTSSGTYSNYYMIIAMTNPPCLGFTDRNSQVINYRGNGSGTLQGTILAPSACIDLRGNGTTANTVNSQVIGYQVTASGDATVNVNYVEAQNHLNPYNAAITLWK